MKECAGFDVVLMVGEGELIGRFVLQRINSMYQNRFIEMTYSNVLGFSHAHKIPVSRSSSSGKEEKKFVESLFSNFVWSFRI